MLGAEAEKSGNQGRQPLERYFTSAESSEQKGNPLLRLHPLTVMSSCLLQPYVPLSSQP